MSLLTIKEINKVTRELTLNSPPTPNVPFVILVYAWSRGGVVLTSTEYDNGLVFKYTAINDGYYKFIGLSIPTESDPSETDLLDITALANDYMFYYSNKDKFYTVEETAGIKELREMSDLPEIVELTNNKTDYLHLGVEFSAEETIVLELVYHADNNTKFDDINERYLSQARSEFAAGNIKMYYYYLNKIQ